VPVFQIYSHDLLKTVSLNELLELLQDGIAMACWKAKEFVRCKTVVRKLRVHRELGLDLQAATCP